MPMRRRLAAVIAFISIAGSGVPDAAAQVVTPPKEAATHRDQDGRRTLRRLPANFGHGIVGVFHRENLLPLVAGGVATGGASVLDQDMRDWINPDPDHGWSETAETAGGPLWSTVFVGGMFTAGRLSGEGRFRAMTYDMLDASMINVVYFQSIKAIVRRERPNGSNNQSFPSGHTSNAFALATVAERHYGWRAGVPAYLLAATMGASRMKQDMHYFSDVVAGATLGYIVGRTVVRVNSRPLQDGSKKGAFMNLAPIASPQTRGLMMSLTF
jgi:hypothetical protein